MKYKLLALDIDGTVVRAHANKPTEKVIEAIRKTGKKMHVSFVSARAQKDIKPLIDLLELTNQYHVLENGTKVLAPDGTIVHDKRLLRTDVHSIIRTTDSLFDEIAFCIDGTWIQNLPDANETKISTISAISYSPKKAEMLSQTIKNLSTPYTVTIGAHWSNPTWRVALISHNEASKGKGLAVIQKELGILPQETIAVGDGASDVPAMAYAGLKAAMGNAEPELLAVANYIAPPVEEDGVVDVIKKYIDNYIQ